MYVPSKIETEFATKTDAVALDVPFEIIKDSAVVKVKLLLPTFAENDVPFGIDTD
jgi:hypothetical protein